MALKSTALDNNASKISKKNNNILSHDEEYILSKKFRNFNDLDSARILIKSHLNYVVKIAKNYKGYGLVLSDLIQEGTIGLMKAVKRFNPNKNVRLISFAIYWVKAEIHEYIIKNLRIIKIATTKSQRKLFFNLKRIKKLGWLNNNDIKHISSTLNIKGKEIKNMELKLNYEDIPFDKISYDTSDSESKQFIPENYIKSKNNDPYIFLEKINWDTYIINKLKTSIKKLDYRSQDIITKRWLSVKKLTLNELSNIYNISTERIRQLENNAIKKLKKLMNII